MKFITCCRDRHQCGDERYAIVAALRGLVWQARAKKNSVFPSREVASDSDCAAFRWGRVPAQGSQFSRGVGRCEWSCHATSRRAFWPSVRPPRISGPLTEDKQVD